MPKCGRIYNLVGSPSLVAGLCDEDGNVLIQREDDRDAVIEQRLDEYEKWARPVLAYYEHGDHSKVDGSHAPEVVFAQIQQLVNKRRPLTGRKIDSEQTFKPSQF